MKKNIINSMFGLAVASLMLTACSSADDAVTSSPTAPAIDDTAINFSAYMNRTTTRGGYEGELDLDALKGAANGFGVMAYYTDNQPYTPNAIPNFMYNQQVTHDGSAWTYSPLKYWPNEFGQQATSTGLDRLSFFAYAPYVAVDPVTGYAVEEEDPVTGDPILKDYGIVGMTRSAENGNPKVRYYVNLDPTKQVDLCWAAPWMDISKLDQPVNEKVKFAFKHALASLNVQVDAKFDNGGTLDDNTRIWVRSVTFEGLAMKGELNLNNDQDNPEWNDLYSNGLLTGEPVTIYDGRRDGREGYAAMPNEKPVAINADLVQSSKYVHNGTAFTSPTQPGVTTTAVNLFAGEGVTATDPVYVIPTGEPLRITIVYDVETYDANLASGYLSDTETHGVTVENNITKLVELAANSPIILKAGKKYTIQLHLGMTSVKLDVDENDFEWGAGDTGNTDLPANN